MESSRSSTDPHETQSDASRREYFRVRTRLAVQTRPIDPEEFEELSAQIRSREAPSPPAADKALAEWLERIESKLDRLLADAGLAEDGSLGPERDVWLSGSGIRFDTEQAYSTGTVLLVEIELPTTPRRVVRTLGRVVDSAATEQSDHAAAIAFVAIHERDRDAVVSYTLAVQRAQIRSGIPPTPVDA